MPFDNVSENTQMSDDDLVALPYLMRGHQGLRQMAALLRRPELKPDNFTWNFLDVLSDYNYHHFLTKEFEPSCGTQGCALGWAILRWPSLKENFKKNNFCSEEAADLSEVVAGLFEISVSRAEYIFLRSGGVSGYEVSPEDVAERIDIVLNALNTKK